MVLTKTAIDVVADSFPDLKASILAVAQSHTSEQLKKGHITASAESLSRSMSRASFVSHDDQVSPLAATKNETYA